MALAAESLSKSFEQGTMDDDIQLARITSCSRCGGLMVIEQQVDLPIHRCVQCGECIDPIILQNRRRSLSVGPG
ncbi:MAG: hypothetical protein K0S45_1916 [Nitrospira sp.]|jgi:hypothetical protein|nr:hypothetical protein [Nitrospira sp.]